MRSSASQPTVAKSVFRSRALARLLELHNFLALRSGDLIASFLARTVLCLLPSLAVWYWARNVVVAPIAWLSDELTRRFLSSLAPESTLDGVKQTLKVTFLTLPFADGLRRVATFQPKLDLLTYCFGLPLFLALLLGSRAKGLLWKLPVGALGLMPFQVWGVCFNWLVSVNVQSKRIPGVTPYLSGWREALADLGYQMGFLLFPILVPVLIWLFLERRFVSTLSGEAPAAHARAPSRSRRRRRH